MAPVSKLRQELQDHIDGKRRNSRIKLDILIRVAENIDNVAEDKNPVKATKDIYNDLYSLYLTYLRNSFESLTESVHFPPFVRTPKRISFDKGFLTVS